MMDENRARRAVEQDVRKRSGNAVIQLRWVITLGSFGLVIWLLTRQGWGEILASLKGLSPGILLLSFVLTMVSRLAVGTRWHILLRSAQLKITYPQSLKITFAGLFASNFLPTTIGGDVARFGMVAGMGYDKAIGAASLVVDRLVGMAGMASAIPFGLPAFIANYDRLVSAALPLPPFLKRYSTRVRQFAARILATLQLWLHRPIGLAQAFLFTWVHMLANAASLWVLLHQLGSDISFGLVLGLWSIVYFITLVPVSINGLGLQELSMTLIYTSIAGVSPENAAIAALVFRTLQVTASLPGFLFLSDTIQDKKRGEYGAE